MSFPEADNSSRPEDGGVKVLLPTNSINSHKNIDSINTLEHSIEKICNVLNQSEEITIDSSDNGEQIRKAERNWAQLPPQVVENIYTFLSRQDQSRMSQVCSAWSKEFGSPLVWKTIQFRLPEDETSSEICPEVKFARKYGYMFRDVEIICTSVKHRFVDAIGKQLCWFLNAMESLSQLTSIKFISMGRCFFHLRGNRREELLRTIISFFNSQKNLKSVTFQHSYFSREEGLELLKAILHSNDNVIRDLTLVGFVNEFSTTKNNPQYRSDLSSVCSNFANIQSLEVDYTRIFEDIILYLYEKLSSGEYWLDERRPRIKNLKIHCNGSKWSFFRGIKPKIWKYLANIFPNMRVKMEVTVYDQLNKEMLLFLVAGIPLQSLDFCFENISASFGTRIADLFIHLQTCKYQAHLEELNINWIPVITNFSECVINFVQSCEKLKTFDLHIACDPRKTKNILEMLVLNHPMDLKYVKICIDYLRGYQANYLTSLKKEYYSLLKAEGVELLLVGDQRLRIL